MSDREHILKLLESYIDNFHLPPEFRGRRAKDLVGSKCTFHAKSKRGQTSLMTTRIDGIALEQRLTFVVVVKIPLMHIFYREVEDLVWCCESPDLGWILRLRPEPHSADATCDINYEEACNIDYLEIFLP